LIPPPTLPSADFEALAWDVTPADILHLWPRNEPLVVLWSGETGPSSRWVYFASPVRRVTFGAAASAAELLHFFNGLPIVGGPHAPHHPPFASGWMGWIAYEAGAVLEPAVGRAADRGPPGKGAFPLMEWFRIEGVLAFDTHSRRWWRTNGHAWHLPDPIADQPFRFTCGPAEPEDDGGYQAAALRTIDYIRAGDIYQANITRQIVRPFSGSGRGLFSALMREAAPWFGAYFETDDPWARRIIASASPELFLSFDASTREVRTRPMKGTWRGTPGPASEAALRTSAKDAAELTMIVDLMRNDLGRVCAPGSICVADHRTIESHAGRGAAPILQTTTSVRGTLAPGRTLADLIRASFPAGSVTGAPKIRAMQIIRELETADRGIYCGAIGSIDDRGTMQLSVAIRTASIVGAGDEATTDGVEGTVTFGVGGGIVADSDPAREWDETVLKASAFRRAADSRD